MFTVERNTSSQTKESYVIRYRGVERDTENKQTAAIIISTAGTTNSSYNITLTNLQDNTTYKYSIVITNCIGNMSTTEKSFKTSYQLKGKCESVKLHVCLQDCHVFHSSSISSCQLYKHYFPATSGHTDMVNATSASAGKDHWIHSELHYDLSHPYYKHHHHH